MFSLRHPNEIHLTRFQRSGYIFHTFFGIWQYFIDPVNAFCLVISIGQVYEYQDYRSLIPLSIFCLISVSIYIHEIRLLLKEESIQNNKLYTSENGPAKFFNLNHKDVVYVKEDTEIPADLIITHGHCLVSELQLTGEDIIIPKSVGGTVFRGTKIILGSIKGIPINLGNECKIYNIHIASKNKTNIQKKILKTCLFNFFIMLILAIIFTSVLYIRSPEKKLISDLKKMILLLNTMVPLSLQFFFNIAAIILSKRIEKSNNVKINTIHTFQTNPHYIVSDKTGTITTGHLKVEKIQTSMSPERCILNIIACSEIQSRSGKLLKSDPIEEALLNHLFTDAELKVNSDTDINFQYKDKDIICDRLFRGAYDYKTEVKSSIIFYDNKYELHLQGTAEAINRYSNNKLTPYIDKLSLFSKPKSAYRRIIAHGMKFLKDEEVKDTIQTPEKYYTDLDTVSLYSLYDYVVEDIHEALVKLDRDFTLLTGDSQKSAIEVSRTIGLLLECDAYFTVNAVRDCFKKLDGCIYIIDGRVLEQIMISNNINAFISVINNSTNRVIYRASPRGKQLYIVFLQKYFNKSVMMVGDGSNDIAALIQSNIGISIKHSDNVAVQNISDIVVDTWTQIPDLLKDCKDQKKLIVNVTNLVLHKHIYSACILAMLFVFSRFSRLRDPASPYLMSFMNGSIFICMCIYCQYALPVVKSQSFILKATIYSIISSIIIFTLCSVSFGIKVSIANQITYLLWWLNSLDRVLILRNISILIVMMWSSYLLYKWR